MDSRLRRALETEAAVTTAKALAEIAPRLDECAERLDRIEALLQMSPAFVREPGAGKPKGK